MLVFAQKLKGKWDLNALKRLGVPNSAMKISTELGEEQRSGLQSRRHGVPISTSCQVQEDVPK